jgi:flagellar operon protein
MTDPYRVQIGKTNGAAVSQPARQTANSAQPADGPSFSDALNRATLTRAQDVRFSNHAQQRLQSRDIQMSEDNVNRLSNAIDKAEKKGGKSSLVLVDDMAFIVNVRDRLVVTALDAGSRGQGVFTQIDSVVFADPAAPGSKSLVDTKG